MPRSAPLEVVRPGLTLGRLTSGLVAGAAGGLAFGALMLANFTINREVGRTGMVALTRQLLGSDSVAVLWAVHMAVSMLLGALFAAIVAPRSYRSSILFALSYGALAWLVGATVALRALVGAPIDLDAGAVFSLVGHLVYGLVLGAAYVAFHDLEVREALDSASPRWRAWGDHERDVRDRPRRV